MTAPPPPYVSDAPPQAPLSIEARTDVSGLREQILDNTPTLWMMAHGSFRELPKEFRVVTLKAPPDGIASTVVPGLVRRRLHPAVSAGQYQAVLMYPTGGSRASALGIFVQGPESQTTEGALRALLDTVEEMIGRRWEKERGIFVGTAILEA